MSRGDLPERLDRKTIYESDYVCLYTDRVKMLDGSIIKNTIRFTTHTRQYALSYLMKMMKLCLSNLGAILRCV